MVGKHLIIDIHKIINNKLLERVETIQPLMEKIIYDLKLNVVGQVFKQFEPVGATLLYLLSESHLSIHTYVEEKYVSIDLYVCNDRTDFNLVLDIIYDFFNGDCWIRKRVLER